MNKKAYKIGTDFEFLPFLFLVIAFLIGISYEIIKYIWR